MGVQPDAPNIPDQVQFGTWGWTLEQAQGSTANWDGEVIDFLTATADGDTAGTAGRVGGVLDLLDSSSNPSVIAIPETVVLEVSSATAMTSDHLADIANKAVIEWKVPGRQSRYYPLLSAVQTNYAQAMQFDHDGDHTQIVSRAAIPALLPGLICDMENDSTFGLRFVDACALIASATERLTVRFYGALVAKDGDIKRDVTKQCDSPATALKQAHMLHNVASLPKALQG